MRNLSPLDISLSSVVSGVYIMDGRVGRLIVILPFHFYRTLMIAKRRLAQGIRRYKFTPFPTISTNSVNPQSRTRQSGGLLLSPMNLESIRK